MSNELANINVTDFKKRVEDHVINTGESLIPEDQFEAMVNAQITAFDKYMKRARSTGAVNKVLDDLCAKPGVENPLVTTTQQLMIDMAGSLFQEHAEQSAMNDKNSVKMALINSGMPDAACKIT